MIKKMMLYSKKQRLISDYRSRMYIFRTFFIFFCLIHVKHGKFAIIIETIIFITLTFIIDRFTLILKLKIQDWFC